MKRIKRFFSFRKKRNERKLFERLGAICMHEFYSSRKLRRKIKGTKLEYLIIKVLKDENK